MFRKYKLKKEFDNIVLEVCKYASKNECELTDTVMNDWTYLINRMKYIVDEKAVKNGDLDFNFYNITYQRAIISYNKKDIIEKSKKVIPINILARQILEAHYLESDNLLNDIEHHYRVVNKLNTTKEKTVGYLHSIIADTNLTLDSLKELGITDTEVLNAIEVLSSDSSDFIEYILKVKQNPLASTVKIEDLVDILKFNSSIDDSIKSLYQYSIDILEKVKTI